MIEEKKDKKTALVTGGAGFIGSHLCERLVQEGYRVISLDNYFTGSRSNHVEGVEYREGHTKDIEQHVPEIPSVVFHLGEYPRVEKSFEDIELVWDLNQFGTFAVLEFCRTRMIKLIYAGSSTKFGDNGLGRDQSPYAWSKASTTDLIKNYGVWFNLSYAIAYFYNVYGPRERSDSYGTVVAIFKEQYRRGAPLSVVSPGTQERIFTHVFDIVDALILIGEKGEGDGFGIGSNDKFSVIELAKLFKREITMFPERQGNRQVASIDVSKTRKLGWEPSHSLAENIKDFTKETKSETPLEKRVIMFTTTFYPNVGPAERALCELMEEMPDIHFDIITTKFSNDIESSPCPVKNTTVHRIGNGTRFDKFLLPIFGAAIATKLLSKHRYLFMWSLMASYGAVAAVRVRRHSNTPLLVTLADQRLSWYVKLFLRILLGRADQIYASTPEQGKRLASLSERMSRRRSLGAGDAFANAMRFAYSRLLRNHMSP